jgi:hypothetical protein
MPKSLLQTLIESQLKPEMGDDCLHFGLLKGKLNGGEGDVSAELEKVAYLREQECWGKC